MKTAAVALIAVGLFTAGAASASDRVSDVDYMKAARCKGLATGLGAESAGLDAFLKEQSASRASIIVVRGAEEMARGKKDAKRSESKDRVNAELSGPCLAYSGSAKGGASSQ
jgi:hypothetical protein